MLKWSTVLFLFLLVRVNSLHADEWRRLLDLRGQWKFEIGDDLQWASPDFDDGSWEKIFVPSSWEEEGYPGYDGYAWYRKTVAVPADLKGKTIYLHLGYIDDADEVYLNGHLVGFSGGFPPFYFTAYNIYRVYRLPNEFLRFGGENVIAVRVFDDGQAGGLVRGKVGLFEKSQPLTPDIPLNGLWRFKTGDESEWKEPDYNDAAWDKVIVPGYWETQGFRHYDGIAWYRMKFYLPQKFKNERLILLLGKIDDLDEVYLNGHLIGRTGRIYDDARRTTIGGEEWLKMREYEIPAGVIRFNQENTLAVRVYDQLVNGGIYDGPVGLITRKEYEAWLKATNKNKKSLWDLFDF